MFASDWPTLKADVRTNFNGLAKAAPSGKIVQRVRQPHSRPPGRKALGEVTESTVRGLKLGVATLKREPWPLAMPRRGGLEGAACAEDGEFVKRLSNELQAYGEMVLPESAGDGKRGQPGQV